MASQSVVHCTMYMWVPTELSEEKVFDNKAITSKNHFVQYVEKNHNVKIHCVHDTWKFERWYENQLTNRSKQVLFITSSRS